MIIYMITITHLYTYIYNMILYIYNMILYIHTSPLQPPKDDFPMVMTMSRRQLTGSGRRIRFQTSSGRLNVRSTLWGSGRHGEISQKCWENHGKIMGKCWENHGKIIYWNLNSRVFHGNFQAKFGRGIRPRYIWVW